MSRTLKVCLVGVSLIAGVVAGPCPAQMLQQGISVVLVPTANAAPMPEADGPNAWIAAATSNGALYFGLNKVTAESLLDEMNSRPHNRQQKLYIKADARAPFANVQEILDAARVAGVEAVLLTAQQEPMRTRTLAPPAGLPVGLDPSEASGPKAVMVLVLASKQGRPTLKVNYKDTSWEALQSSLTTLLQRQREKVVLVKADGSLPVAPVVNVIDVCRSTGAKVVLVTPGAEGAAQDTEVTITKGSAWGIVRLKPAAHFADE